MLLISHVSSNDIRSKISFGVCDQAAQLYCVVFLEFACNPKASQSELNHTGSNLIQRDERSQVVVSNGYGGEQRLTVTTPLLCNLFKLNYHESSIV